MSNYRSNDKGHKEKDSQVDLSVPQLLAATGATTIGAVLVKFLDIWGTVLGTAVLSVCTSIGAVLIMRTMRSTGDKIKSQITALSPTGKGDQDRTVELGADRVTATAAIPSAEQLAALNGETAVLETAEPSGDDGEYVAKPPSRRRTLLTILVSSVLVFALTIGVLFLIGSLTGDPGRFVQQRPDESTSVILESPEDNDDSGERSDEGTVEQTEPTEDGAPTDDQAPTDQPTQGEEPSEAPTADEPPTEEPTDEPNGDQGEGGGEEPSMPEQESADELSTTE